MYKTIRLLSGIGISAILLASCEVIETRISPYPGEVLKSSRIDYETSDDGPLIDDQTDQDDDQTDQDARLAPPYERGKITIGYMSNETEIFRPSSYTVTLWRRTAKVNAEGTDLAAEVAGKKPTTTAKKNSPRSYVRKTLGTGWYIANVNDSNMWLQFQVTANSDGLLCWNENSFTNKLFNGYYPSYGKVKVSMWYGTAKPTDCHVTLSRDVAEVGEPYTLRDLDTWLYAEDGTGAKKGMFWFMPAYTYASRNWANKPDGSGSYPPASTGNIVVAPGKTYPHLKLVYN